MPGATTARLVVCAFEIPMKLFMMPHTVPNRPTNGAVEPMVASTPVPRCMPRPAADFEAREARRHALLLADLVGDARRQAQLVLRGFDKGADDAAFSPELVLRGGERTAPWPFGPDSRLSLAFGTGELDGFRQPDGPRHDGRDGEADHHRFDDDIRLLEHAPRRQIARQMRGADGGSRRQRSPSAMAALGDKTGQDANDNAGRDGPHTAGCNPAIRLKFSRTIKPFTTWPADPRE